MIPVFSDMIQRFGLTRPVRDEIETVPDILEEKGFKRISWQDLPSRDFFYPDTMQNGLSELHRFFIHSAETKEYLRTLEARLFSASTLFAALSELHISLIESFVPRMMLKEQCEKETLFSRYAPFLIMARDETGETLGYVVKPDVKGIMVWFALTEDETALILEQVPQMH